MAMTREQVLAEMESSYELMTVEERDSVLFNDRGQDWTPTLLLAEVRGDTEIGQEYVRRWGESVESQALLGDLLAALLGGDGMTCGDPNCPNCKGEVRPFDALPGTGTDPTIH